ncbi:enoyl-ACP reductase [Hydrogenophaga soli]|nr:enoyl-ACP reductase FabI [Burkholderiaceae bacterium]
MFSLAGKKALVVGIANDQSIAWGVAQALHRGGAQVAVTYLNAKAEPHVRPLAEQIGSPLICPLDVSVPGQDEVLFQQIQQQWGALDILVHSIAFAPRQDLHGRVVDASLQGFVAAMDVSVHSFIRLTRLAEPLMKQGGACMAMSYYGAEKVVEGYNLMGPVKAALEATVRELAAELGDKNISVNALSPGPMLTRAAGGIAQFDALMDRAVQQAPMHRLATPEDVGALAAFLACEQARNITGNVIHVDAGAHIMG